MARQTNGLHDPNRDPRPNSTHPSLQYDFEGMDVPSIKHSLANRLIYTVGKDSYTATPRDWLHAVAYIVRDRLTERWMETMRNAFSGESKRVYYSSLEFLIGRSLTNSLLNLGFYEEADATLKELGMDLEELAELEFDAALGNASNKICSLGCQGRHLFIFLSFYLFYFYACRITTMSSPRISTRYSSSGRGGGPIKRRELSGDLVLTEDWCIDQGSDWLFSWEGPDSYARKKQAEKACFKNFDWTTTTNERQMR